MNKNVFKIDILGTSFSIQTDETQEKMDNIISILKNKTQMVQTELGITDPLKNAIISSIIIIDDFLKEKNNNYETNNNSAEVEKLTMQILEKIDKRLE